MKAWTYSNAALKNLFKHSLHLLALTPPIGKENCLHISHCINTVAFFYSSIFYISRTGKPSVNSSKSLKSTDILWTEVSSWYMGINAVKAGHGVFLCPKFMVQEELDQGTLIHLFPNTLQTNIEFYVNYSKNSSRKARIEAFVNWLSHEANTNS